MLKDYTSNDYNRIKEEIIKLKMYKLDTKEINEDDIKKQLLKIQIRIFLIQLIIFIKKINKKYLKFIYELIENNEDELKIIGFLSNNYTLIYKIQEL